jgi:hypothetical protein
LYEAFEPRLVEENVLREVDEDFVVAGATTDGQGEDEVTRRLEALGYLG